MTSLADTASVGTRRPLALPKPSTSEVQRNLESPGSAGLMSCGALVYMSDLISYVSNRLQLACRDSIRGLPVFSLLSLLTFAMPTFLYWYIMWAKINRFQTLPSLVKAVAKGVG